MQTLQTLDHLRPDNMATEEWHARLELAACYRLFDYLDWTQLIYNHITLRVPGSSDQNPQYLINPFGLHYTEVTARNLIKTDIEGNITGESEYPINPAGFTIHSAVHGARHDAHCVMHTHTTEGMAVACKEEGLRYDNFYSALFSGDMAYHDFEGITTNPDECERLVASLGEKSCMILRNHGLLVAGPDVPSTFERHWALQRACEVQIAADSAGGKNIPISEQVLAGNEAQRKKMLVGATPSRASFDAMLRRAGIRYEDLAG